MGIFQADAILATSVRLFLEDLRKNIWLMDYILEDFITNPYLIEKYGQKQVDSAKEWFLNTQIDVCIGYHPGKLRPPCVSIGLGSQPENSDMKHMGDHGVESVILLPNQITKPISYVVKPFVPVSYDESSGELVLDPDIDVGSIAIGMILVNPANGNGYIITDIDSNSVFVEPGLEIVATQLGIVPQFQYYKARVEHIFMNANYSIICTTHGDPQTTLWLHDIILYGLLRYKESLLEALGLSETVLSSGDLEINREFGQDGAETAWDRAINITGQIEQTFIKAPHRIIEVVNLKEKAAKGIKASTGFKGGITIISNEDTPSFVDQSNETWVTEDDNDEDDD